MTAAMTQMMTQISDTIGTQMNTVMDQFATDMSSAFSMDPNAFAEAFKSNVDEKSLAALMATMFSTNVPTLETNLRNLGWADIASPSNISIYPKSFADKDKVKATLDTYNKDNEAAGATDKVITYSDIMGALMSSVTKIVDIVSWLLIAFVSISLVVSSIMISIITYISVLERRKEIGILRSIGASKGDVSRVFNAETIIEGFLAGTIGVGVTYGAVCARQLDRLLFVQRGEHCPALAAYSRRPGRGLRRLDGHRRHHPGGACLAPGPRGGAALRVSGVGLGLGPRASRPWLIPGVGAAALTWG